jgi:hypothetical protein
MVDFGCAPLEDRFALGFVIAALVAAALAVRTRAVAGQHGFTGFQSIVILAILLIVAAVLGLMVLGCAGADVGPAGAPVPEYTILKGQYPTNAPSPSCQTGTLCTKTGGLCGLPRKKCLNTIEWDGGAAKWRCACECR